MTALTLPTIARYQRKALSVIEAWGALFGVSPTLRAIVRAMSVAEFETHLGDARGWAGEHNWGAIKKRALSPLERNALAAKGIDPNGGDAALFAARATLHAGPDEALHTDSSPAGGKHFAWFWAFPSDFEAARKFLQVLVIQRPKVRAVLELDDITEMARAMFETGYYEGFHKNDPAANIRDYARRIGELEPLITRALTTTLGAPSQPAPAPSPVAPSPHTSPLSAPRSRTVIAGGVAAGLLLSALMVILGAALSRAEAASQ